MGGQLIIGRIEEAPESVGGDSKTTTPRCEIAVPSVNEAERALL
jgi:hypothetical protein